METNQNNSIPITKTPLISGTSVEEKRKEILQYFHETFDTYKKLFEPIKDDSSFFKKPDRLRHPLIFYYGHTAVFFINKLILGKFLNIRVNPTFESSLAIGVDEMSWDDLDTGSYNWPNPDEVRDYRNKVRAVVDNLISEMPLTLPINKNDPAWVILMGIEHERIHLETSSVLIRMLPIEDVTPHPAWPACKVVGPAPQNKLIPINDQKITLGKKHDDYTFGWDNEFGTKNVQVDDYEASQFLVSNEEFLDFINDNGYKDLTYWTDEGKKWLKFSKATMPRFWLVKNKDYYQRNFLEEIKLPMNWPAEVNYLEAKAFCNWKSKKTSDNYRLPIEAEWHTLRNLVDSDQPNWKQAPGNINLEHFASSCPVDQFSTNGIYDIIGNVWQWTESNFDSLSGFEVHPLYDDFSTPTFDGKHNLIKGGSWISTGNESLKSSRYAFRRHFFQHAGFRYIKTKDNTLPKEPVNTYETDELISQYLEFHYGDDYFNVPNFPKNCIDTCMQYIDKNSTATSDSKTKALDLGCSVGRSTFELAKYYDHVDGIDFSARFIQSGVQLQENGIIKWTIPTEGELVNYKEATFDTLNISNTKKKVHFSQGDACNLKSTFNNYDLVFAGNLLDRLYDPNLFLKNITERISSHGFLVLTSPYTWLEEHTTKENWLGGFKDTGGENQTTLDGLKLSLTENFNFLGQKDIPFVIRETKRKHQHTISNMTVWQKKS